jgi:hypothetical protein
MCSQADDPTQHDEPRHIAPRTYVLSGAQSTPDDVRVLAEHAPMPPGFTLTVEPQRRHLLRSLWAVRVFRDGERVWGRAVYSPAQGIVMAQRWAWNTAGVPE